MRLKQPIKEAGITVSLHRDKRSPKPHWEYINGGAHFIKWHPNITMQTTAKLNRPATCKRFPFRNERQYHEAFKQAATLYFKNRGIKAVKPEWNEVLEFILSEAKEKFSGDPFNPSSWAKPVEQPCPIKGLNIKITHVNYNRRHGHAQWERGSGNDIHFLNYRPVIEYNVVGIFEYFYIADKASYLEQIELAFDCYAYNNDLGEDEIKKLSKLKPSWKAASAFIVSEAKRVYKHDPFALSELDEIKLD